MTAEIPFAISFLDYVTIGRIRLSTFKCNAIRHNREKDIDHESQLIFPIDRLWSNRFLDFQVRTAQNQLANEGFFLGIHEI